MSEERTAWGWGLASVDAAGTTLDVWYPELTLGPAPAEADRGNHNFGALAHAAGRGAGVPLVFYIAGTVVAFWSFVLKAEKSEEKKDEALYGGNADKRDGKDNKPQAENGKNESTGRAA